MTSFGSLKDWEISRVLKNASKTMIVRPNQDEGFIFYTLRHRGDKLT